MNKNEEQALRKASPQIPALTNLEFKILVQIKNGLTSGEIAFFSNCSTRTIEKHRSNIIRKLGIPSAQNALLVWILANSHYFDT